jgi:hypothetical protein
MRTTMSKPMKALLDWDDICREFGCSDAQMRELYSAPCPDAAPATESYDDVMAALNQEAEAERPTPGYHAIKVQN